MSAHPLHPQTLTGAHNDAAGECVLSVQTAMPGIVMGKPVVIEDHIHEPADISMPADGQEQEVTRYEQGRQKALAKYERLMAKVSSLPLEIRQETSDAVNFEQKCVQNDAVFKTQIPQLIRQGKTAQRAVYVGVQAMIDDFRAKRIDPLKAELQACADPAKIDTLKTNIEAFETYMDYFDHIRQAVLREVDPDFNAVAIADLQTGNIPVISYINVHTILEFADDKGRARIPGSVNTKGNNMDHPNIIARGIGAILSRLPQQEFEALCRDIKAGRIQEIILDAKKHQLIINPSADTKARYTEAMQRQQAISAELLKRSQREDGWTYSHHEDPAQRVKIKIGANIGLSTDMHTVNESHAKGVGLCRTELAVLLRKRNFPSENDWFAIFKDIIERGRDPVTGKTKKITFRTVDFAGDKMDERISGTPEEKEAKKTKIIRNQMAAAIRAAKFVENDQEVRSLSLKPRVFLMIPNVTSPEELEKYQAMMDAEHKRLQEKDQCLYPSIQLGAMVENPAIVRKLDQLKASFLSIGTNDLIPYTLGYNRFDPDADSKYDPTDPAVLEAIQTTVQRQTPQCPVSVCGDMASNPRYFALLIGIGVRNLSASAAQVPFIKELARRIDVEAAQALHTQIHDEPSREARERILDEFNRTHLGLNADMTLNMNWQPPVPEAPAVSEPK